MKARYIISLDDANPYMKKENWDKIENLLDKYQVKPIVAVIPNNKDKTVMFEEFENDFWNRIKRYMAKGWKIGLHGHEHVMHKSSNSVIPINDYSEFSGLPYDVQYSKLKEAKRIFEENGIYTDLWIAPAHGFDYNTLRALQELGINYISDGFAFYPFFEHGFIWIPQQLWRYRWMPFGVWTICLHPNVMTEEELRKFSLFLEKHHSKIIDFETVTKMRIKRRNLLGKIIEKAYLGLVKARKSLRERKT